MATQRSLEIAARCWCDPRTSHTIMDPVLAEVFAETLDAELQPMVAWNHDWQCGCGHWNGPNLDHCGDCGRTPYDTRRAMQCQAQ